MHMVLKRKGDVNMYKTLNTITPDKIKGNIAILCDLENLKSATVLIKDFSETKAISLYIENKNNVSIYNNIPAAIPLNSTSPEVEVECSLEQCFSPLEYSCTVCIGENKSFCSIADTCRKYATPVYIVESIA